MALPKPEYIQNFIEEKLKKRKKGEALPLLKSGEFQVVNETSLSINHNSSSASRLQPASSVVNGNSLSSGISESDDATFACRGSAKEQSRIQRKSIASDADLDTDDSGKQRRRKGISANGANSRKCKKSKDLKPLLKGSDEQCTNYGGTVSLDCDGTQATYNTNETKIGKQVDSVHSGNNKRHQQSISNGGTVKKLLKKNKKPTENELCDSGTAFLKNHKHGDDSSSDSGQNSYSRRYSMESEHCHDSSEERSERDKKKRKKAMRKLLYATGLSFLFMVGEIIGGYLANSLAVMTDASHLLTDVSSFLISILALKMASRPISKKMTFGWHRSEVIGALISVVAIWIVTGVLVYLAIERLISNSYVVHGRSMLITAGLAVVFNIVMGLVLHEHGHFGGHSHSHSHSHDHEAGSNVSGTDEDSSESGNVNVRAAFIHVVGDLLQSLGVLTAAFIIYFKPSYKIADPICTFLFSIFVLITTITILRDTIIIIMEGSPVNIEYNVVKDKLLEIEGVAAVHDLRIWSLTLNQTVMSAHLAINKYVDPNDILKRATRKLKALYDFHSLTIQVEFYSDDMNSCKKCQQT